MPAATAGAQPRGRGRSADQGAAPRGRGVRRKALVLTELAEMVTAGTPVDDALATLGSALGGADGRRLSRAAERLQAGTPMAQALDATLGLDDVERALVATAVRTGRLAELLGRLADRQETLVVVRGRLLRALVWPLLTLLMSAALLPVPTLVRSGPGAWIAETLTMLAWIAGAAAIVGVGVPALWRRPGPRGAALAAADLVPGLARLAAARRMGLLFGALAPALDAGLSLTEALPLAGRATGEPRVARQLAAMPAGLAAGQDLVSLLARVPGLDAPTRARLASGVRSGRLADAALRLARDHAAASRRATEVVGTLLRFSLTLGISLWVASALMGQLQELLTNPLSAVPGGEAQELQRELRRVLPSLGL